MYLSYVNSSIKLFPTIGEREHLVPNPLLAEGTHLVSHFYIRLSRGQGRRSQPDSQERTPIGPRASHFRFPAYVQTWQEVEVNIGDPCIKGY